MNFFSVFRHIFIKNYVKAEIFTLNINNLYGLVGRKAKMTGGFSAP